MVGFSHPHYIMHLIIELGKNKINKNITKIAESSMTKEKSVSALRRSIATNKWKECFVFTIHLVFISVMFYSFFKSVHIIFTM
ncbi:hypothetical protein BCR22_10690 [Enterococcus plantarum]|nr:hypothetical protein BCR22_10690 [Enterococcus plantarum]